MEDTPAISVVVPVRDGETTIADCLRSILRTDYPPTAREIIVVDNASIDRTPRIVRSFPVRYVTESAAGPSSARNRGIAESQNGVLAFIDADCVATRGWLRELAFGFRPAGVTGVAGEILPYPPRTPAERFMAARHPRWQEYALNAVRPYAATANVAFRRETFAQIGVFDPRMVRAQDLDFGWRFFGDRRMRMAYAPRALVLHRHRASTRGFIRQQVGWAYGRALLHAKYGLPWTMKDEIGQYGKLAASILGATGMLIRYAIRRADRSDLDFAFFEMLRCAASRIGALQGLMDTRDTAPWSAAPAGSTAK